jgi:hypothetical protein
MVLSRVRRAIVVRAEAQAMNVIPSTEEADAIFGLIAAHRVAWSRFVELDDRDHETLEEGGRAADAAMTELMKTPPTTLAGIRAIIQYLVDWDNDSGYYYLPTLLRSPLLNKDSGASLRPRRVPILPPSQRAR